MSTSRNLPRTPAKDSGSNNHNNNSKGKKKRIFGVFGGGKKKSPETEASDDTPATAPSTPEALNVTVMDTLYDPSYAYELTTAESNVSGLTDQYTEGVPGGGGGGTPPTASATQARKVGFDMIEEEVPPPAAKNENDVTAGGMQKNHNNNAAEYSLAEEEGGGTTVASTALKTEVTGDTVDLSDPTKSCSSPDFLVNQTLGMFDDFCSPPKSTMASPERVHARNRQHQMCGGNLADDYEFDDYSYQPSQLESTVGDSTNDHSYSIQTGNTTTNISSDDVNKAGGGEKSIASTTPKKTNTNLPPGFQDHENFEVVLDTALLQGVAPPTSKRRSLFAQFASNKQQREDPGVSEEEKKDDREPPAGAGFSSDDDAGYHSSSLGGRKSSIVKRLFSTRKVKDELDNEEEENVAAITKAVSAPKTQAPPKSVPSRAASPPPVKTKREVPVPAPSRVPATPAPAPVAPPPVKKVSSPVEIDRRSRPQSLEDAKSEPSDEGRLHRTELIERVKSQNLDSATAVPAAKEGKPSPSPSPTPEDPDMKEKEENWNSMLAQLMKKPSPQKSQQQQQPKDDSAISSLPKESVEETKTTTSKSSSRKDRKQMIHSLSHRVRKGLSKKIIKPIKSARKWATEEIATKNETNSKKKAAPAPAPAPPPPVLPAAPVQVPKKPKPIWKAVVDPKTGRTYYYHRKTRETTWIKPEELLAYEADQSPNTKQGKEEAKADSSQNNETPVTNAQKVEDGVAGMTTDEVVVSDDRFNTPPRGKVDESEQETTPEESPIVPPAVVKTGNAGMNSLLDRVESEDNAAAAAAAGARSYDLKWEKKKEIERLLTSLSPPDKSSVDNLMKQYEGKEDVLLRQLREKVESQPFDEPFSDEPIGVGRSSSKQTAHSAPSRLFTRTTTFVSKGSAKTKSSTITDKTEKIKNTWKGGKQAITTISEIENTSAATSISSHQEDNMARSPIRQRELMVEELTGSRIAAETYEPNGKVTRSGASEYSAREDGSDLYFGDNEVDTCTSDSVSALSDHDGDFLSRKENFDQARRRALDDAIEREDWDLAAVLAEGMRAGTSTGNHPKSNYHPSELETLVATNDWDAVKRCISKIQSQKRASLKAIEEDPESLSVGSNTAGESYTTGGFTDPSVVKAPSRPGDLDQDNPLTKRVGSRSQLQHRELVSESSWTSDSSYESSDDSDYS